MMVGGFYGVWMNEVTNEPGNALVNGRVLRGGGYGGCFSP